MKKNAQKILTIGIGSNLWKLLMSNNNFLGLPPINPDYSFGLNPFGSNPENLALPKGEIRETNQDSIKRRVAVDIIATDN